MAEEPLVSIILPTYNRADWLPQSIESVLLQTYQNWELIIWDDGSSDQTIKILGSYADKRIRYYSSKNNRGKSYALNKSLKMTNGKYIAFLDDDDQWVPKKLSSQVECLEIHKIIDIMFSNFLNFNLASQTAGLGFHQTRKGINKLTTKKLDTNTYLVESGLLEGLTIKNFIAFDSVILKRKILRDFDGFEESLRNSEDILFWTELSLNGYNFAFSEEILLKRFKPINSLSSPSIDTYLNTIKSANFRYDLFNKFKRNDLIKQLNPTYTSAYNGLIREYALIGDRKRAFLTFRKVWQYGVNFRTLYLLLGAILGPKIIGIIKKR